MIFFFGDGRLGNQIFQYAFIKSVEKKEQIIISCNFEEMLELFDNVPKVINIKIKNKYIKSFIRKIGIFFFNFISRLRVITYYNVNRINLNGFSIEDTSFTRRRGLLPLKYFYPFFAQSETFFLSDSINQLNIKQEHLEKALRVLESLPKNTNKVFIHIRRGDYVNVNVFDIKDVTVPMAYCKNSIKWFQENIENPFFIFLTDDLESVECFFQEVEKKIISNNSMYIDFAIMTFCEYGIISNSSFSWWASYMMKSRKKVFAPKYWLGWKSKVEYPKGITPSFVDVIEIDK